MSAVVRLQAGRARRSSIESAALPASACPAPVAAPHHPAGGFSMDALDELEQMHEEARAAFAKIETSGSSDRAGAWAKLHAALKLHEQIEEKFVYDPVVEEIGDTDTRLDAF